MTTESRPTLSIIAAMARNRVIGRDNRLPWRLPADLRHFKTLTMEKPMIMGRNTWESLPGLLPGRRHIVLTRDTDYRAEGAEIAHDLDQAIRIAGDVEEIMIIGGEQIYRQALPRASQLLLTLVDLTPDGDAWFPEFSPAHWREEEREEHPGQGEHPGYAFVRYKPRRP